LHEVQVFQARLPDLESRRNACNKKSGHADYIPLRDFTISNLPRDYFDEDVVQLVRAIADLTVKISLA
ncbi:RNA polymerase II-associated protein 3, partial [Biomphalaria glabrata]